MAWEVDMCPVGWPDPRRLATLEAFLVCESDTRPLHSVLPPRPEELHTVQSLESSSLLTIMNRGGKSHLISYDGNS